jgi:hypothetical protein
MMTTRRLLVAGDVVALALGGVAIVVRQRQQPPLQASLAVVDDSDRFTTALEASDAFAEIGSRLTRVDCDAGRDEGCARLHRAGAWAEVSAVLVAQCSPADVFTARAGLGRYLRRGGELPPVPKCGARRQVPS